MPPATLPRMRALQPLLGSLTALTAPAPGPRQAATGLEPAAAGTTTRTHECV